MTFLYEDSEDYFAHLQLRLDQVGIRQNQLAAAMGITAPELNRWISGRVEPSIGKVIQLERALDQMLRAQVERARRERA